jgi:hypothetical protein
MTHNHAAQHWLHHVGRQYYPTMEAFELEALQQGVTRRVALSVLRHMRWGDQIVFGFQTGPKDPERIFGTCPITVLSGLSAEGAAVVVSLTGVTPVQMPRRTVVRGCGHYRVAATYQVHNVTGPSLAEIAAALAKITNPGLPMMGGEYAPGIPVGPVTLNGQTIDQGFAAVRLPALKPARGFRVFDWAALQHDLAMVRLRPSIRRTVKVTSLRGGFYPSSEDPQPAPVPVWGCYVEQVTGYTKQGADHD